MEISDERRHELCFDLYHARRALAAVPEGDVNGKADVIHRIRHIENELGAVDEKAFADFCLRMDEVVKERVRIIRERNYERTGVIYGD
jgi:hypothetical protein